jgi:aspartate aminotransferase-like enzyme
MERLYLSIINALDTLWANTARAELRQPDTAIPYVQASASFASQAMTRTLENEGIDRFLSLYRYNNIKVEEAHRLLGFYYAVSGRPSAQQHLMFAFLIQNSIIIEESIRHQYDFTFTSLSALAEEINRNSLLSSYVEAVEYYKTAYYLGASLYRNGKTSIARDFWTFLAAQPQAGEWRGRALGQLRNPHLEPIVEMP